MNKINRELEFLMNPMLYNIYTKKKNEETYEEFKLEKDKYKSKILDFTKSMFEKSEMNEDIDIIFENYVKSCIYYIKHKENTDFYQSEYKHLVTDVSNCVIRDFSMSELNNKLISLNKNNETSKLDKYVKKINNKQPLFIPKKKNINDYYEKDT